MSAHDQLYATPDDCQWLRETALRGYDGIPAFASFTISGHEDCPLEIVLYAIAEPLITTSPIARYVLRTDRFSNLGQYHREDSERGQA